MGIRIFHFAGSDDGYKRTLELEDDGTLIYDKSPNYYAYKNGAWGETRHLSPAAAKAEWPGHAKEIDDALEKLRGAKKSN